MPDSPDLLLQFYNNLLSTGKVKKEQIGDYEFFQRNLTDTEKAQKLYNNLINKAKFSPKEIGDWDSFYGNVKSSLTPKFASPAEPYGEDTRKPSDMIPDTRTRGGAAPMLSFTGLSDQKGYNTAAGLQYDFEKDFNTLDKRMAELDQQIKAAKPIREYMRPANTMLPGGGLDASMMSRVMTGDDAPPPDDEQYKKLQRDKRYMQDAKDLLTIAQRRTEVGDQESITAFMKGLTSPLAKDFLTAGLSDMMRTFDVVGVARKAGKGESITEDEQVLLQAYGLLQTALQQPGSMSYNVGAGMSEMIPYMVQFAATSGAGNVVKGGVNTLLKVTEKNLRNTLKNEGAKAAIKQVGKELPGIAAKAGTQMPMMPMAYSMTGEKLIGEVSPEGDIISQPSVPEGIARGLANAFPEILTENMGAHLIASGKVALSPFKRAGKVLGAKEAARLNKMLTPVEKFRKAAAFGNFAEEYSEEMANNFLSATLDPELSYGEAFSGENMITTALVIAGMGGGFYATNKAYTFLDEKALQREHLSGLPEGVRKDVIRTMKGNTPAEISKNLDNIIRSNDLDKDQVRGVLGYSLKRSMREGMEGSMDEFAVQEGQRIMKEDVQQKAQEFLNDFAYQDHIIQVSLPGRKDQPFYVVGGPVRINEDGTINYGNEAIIVTDQDGNREMVHPKNISESRAMPAQSYVDQVMSEAEMQINNENLTRQAVETVQGAVKEATEPPVFITGDKITHNGREAEIQDARDIERGITVVYTDNDEVSRIAPEEYQNITKQGSTTATVDQPGETPAAQPGMPINEPGEVTDVAPPAAASVELEATIDKAPVKYSFKAQDDGTYQIVKPFTSKPLADKVMKAFDEEYANLEFEVVNIADPADPFAKNQFVVRARQREITQPVEQTEVLPADEQKPEEVFTGSEQDAEQNIPRTAPAKIEANVTNPVTGAVEQTAPTGGKDQGPEIMAGAAIEEDENLPADTQGDQAAGTEVPGAEEEVKQPWQMTKEEFEDANYDGEDVTGWNESEEKEIADELNRQSQEVADTERSPEGREKARQLEAQAQAVADQFYENNDHRKQVEKALSEGKAVPPEVLADYPDLQAKPIPETPQESGEKVTKDIEQAPEPVVKENFTTEKEDEGVSEGKEPNDSRLESLLRRKEKAEVALQKEKDKNTAQFAKEGWGAGMRKVKVGPSFAREDELRERLDNINKEIENYQPTKPKFAGERITDTKEEPKQKPKELTDKQKKELERLKKAGERGVKKVKRDVPQRWKKVLERDAQSFEESVLQFLLGGGRFKTDDFIRHTGFGDKKAAARRRKEVVGKKELGIARLHFLTQNGTAMDTFSDHREVFGMDKDGMGIINGIIDILLDHKSKWSVAERLEQLQSIKETSPEDFVDPELLAEAQREADIETESRQDEIVITFTDDEALNDMLKAEFLNDDGTINYQQLSDKLAEDKGFFTIFPYGFTESQIAKLETFAQDGLRSKEKTSESLPANESEGERDDRAGGDQETPEGTRGEGKEEVTPPKQRAIDEIRKKYVPQIDKLKSELISEEELRDRQKKAIDKANKKINIFGKEGDLGEQDMFAGQRAAFDTSPDAIRKEVADDVAAENKRIQDEITRLDKEMRAEIKLAEGQTEMDMEVEEKKPSAEKSGYKDIYPITNLSGDKFIDYPDELRNKQNLLEDKWRELLRKNNGPTDESIKAQEKLRLYGKENMYIKVSKQEGIDYLSKKPYIYGQINFSDVYSWVDTDVFQLVNENGMFEFIDDAKKYGLKSGGASAIIEFTYTPEAVTYIIRKLSEHGYNVFDVNSETFYPNKPIDKITTSQQSKPEQKIEDFGEKIEGARKDQIKKYFDKINLNGRILSVIFPKPDIQQLIANGLSVKDAAGIKVAHEFAVTDKKRGEEVMRFYAAYAKSILAESIKLEFRNEEYVFTDYGKSQIVLRTQAYERIAKELGQEYLSLDLTKAGIREITDKEAGFYVNRPTGKYEVKYYVSPRKYFDTLDEAINEFVAQIKANTTKDTITYKHKLSIYRSLQNGDHFIAYKPSGKPIIHLKDGFKSAREAFDYKVANEADLQTELDRILAEQKGDTKRTVTRLKYSNETARERVGKDWRNGKNVGSKEFAETFGFRGVEFGNWVNQKERQVFMNNSYDSLMDLAQLLNIPPSAISLGGNLAVSFGSRGSGHAAAHYEPGRKIINLTKTQGLGALAHEWFHSIDNYFAGFETGMNHMKSATGGNFTPETRQEIKSAFDKLYETFRNSEFKKRSQELDMSKNKNYFSLNHEMAARAFENYVLNRLKESGQINDFIVNYISKDDWNGQADMYPYPVGEETSKIAEAFNNLFETIETKEEDGNTLLYQLTDDDVFFSNSIRALESITQPKATPEQWKAMLMKNGAKEAELEWMGWDEFTQGRKSLTKDEVRSWMEANKVELTEVELGDYPPEVQRLYSELLAKNNGRDFDDWDEADQDEWMAKRGEPRTTKYADYQTPGGEDYRELLITMPMQMAYRVEKVPDKPLWNIIDNETGKIWDVAIDEDNAYKVAERYTELKRDKTQFKSFHFDQPNIVVHVRFNSRTDADGNRVLFIEEVQSDWAEKGRKEGFGGREVYRVESEPGRTAFVEDFATREAAENAAKDLPFKDWKIVSVKSTSAVPDMPFKNTSQWVGLAMKRMIRYAADNGFDRIAWTTGEMQAERYDLSKQVDKVLHKKNEKGNYDLKGWKDGDEFLIGENINESELPNVVGKELAEKIINTPPDADTYGGFVIKEGGDLKVGGQGMKAFYDQIIPNWVNKFGKKYGVRVGETKVFTGGAGGQYDNYRVIQVSEEESTKQWLLQGKNNGAWNGINYFTTERQANDALKEANKGVVVGESIPSFPITDQLREAAIGGFPMFRLVTNPIFGTFRHPMEIVDAYETMGGFVQALKDLAGEMGRELNTTIRVATDRDALPLSLKNKLSKKAESGKMRAFYDPPTDTVWLIAQAMPNTAEAVKSILHETVAHRGLPMILGPRFNAMLDSMWTSIPEADKMRLTRLYIAGKKWDEMSPEDRNKLISLLNTSQKRLLAEEYLAWKAERLGKAPGFVKRAIAQIRTWLRKMFGLRWNDNDIAVLLSRSREHLRRQENTEVSSFAGLMLNDRMQIADIPESALPLKEGGEFNINATGDVVTGDHVEFDRDLWGGSFKNPKWLGTEKMQAIVVNDSYGKDKQQHTFTLELYNGKKTMIKGRNLYKNGVMRKEWQDEGARQSVLDEKHDRGDVARQERDRRRSGRLYGTDDIRYQLADPTFTEPTPEEAIIGKSMLQTSEDKFREFIQDKMLSVRRLQEKIEREGGHVDDLSDIYNDENRSSSRSKAQMEEWENKSWTPLVELISRISRDYNMSLDDIQTYMKAKHAPERNKYYNEKYKTTDQVYAGKIRGYESSDAVSGFYVDAFENAVPDYVVEEMWEKVGQATGYALDRYLNDGFISRDMYDEIKARYEYYIPLRGWKAETADEIFDYQDTDIQSGFNPFKKAFGRESEADDPLPYIWAMANTAIVSGNKNLVKQKALNLYRQNKDRSDLFRIQKLYIVEDPITGNATEQVEKPDQALFDAGLVSTKYNPIHHPRITRYMANQHELIILEGGQRHLMTFTDPNVAIAINGENVWRPEFSRFIQESIGRTTRYISTMLTSKNPAFIPVNWIRDVGMASMWHFIRNEGDTGKFIKNMPIAAQAIRRYFNGKAQDNPNQMDQKYMAWLLGGGATGYVHLKDMDQLRRKMEREFRVLTDTRKKMDYVTTNKMVSLAGEWLNYMAQMSENMSRFATYLTSLEMGRTHEQALSDSKNVTVNFNRKGRISGLLNSLFAFFNANIQGSHTLLKLGKDYPMRTARVAIGFMALGYLTAALSRLLSPPDEDGVKYYDKLSPFIKQNFMVLPNPLWLLGKQQDKFVTIPLPWGFSALYSMGVIAHDWQTEQATVMDGMFSMANNIYSAFSPINFGKGVLTGEKIGTWKMARPLVPTAAMPLYDVAMNEDFAGYQIFREPFTKELEKITPESELGMPYTNRYLTIATRNLNKFMGGDEYRKARWKIDHETGELKDQGWRNLFDVNPSKLEHILEGYTGGVGTELNNVIKTITSAVEKAQGVPGAEVYSRNIPVLRRLYRQASKGNTSRDYYEYKEMIDTYSYLINKYRNERMAEPYGKMIQWDQIKASQKVMEATEKRISALREKAKRLPDDSEALTELYDQMDELRTEAVTKIKELNFKER